MASTFKLYPKISAAPSGADPVKAGPWVALEKIHGAQMVIAVTESDVRFGKRKAWLGGTEPFFGWQLLRGELLESARALHRAVGSSRATITIYGELFGGNYPHPSVPAVPGMAPVQTGIWYAPDLHYSVFDVHLSPDPASEGELLSHSEVTVLAREASFLSVPVLGRAPRPSLSQLPVRFSTRVPALFGLPPIEDNWAEGLVLKADARARLSERAIVKRKIPEFDEAVFDESAPWDPDQAMTLEQLLSWAARLVNAPRVASARSKCGDGDTAALLEEIGLDVQVDLEMAFPLAMKGLSPDDEEALRSRVKLGATSLLTAPPPLPAGCAPSSQSRRS